MVLVGGVGVAVLIGDSLVEHVEPRVFRQGGVVEPLHSLQDLRLGRWVDNGVVGDGYRSGGEDMLRPSSYFPLYL